MEPASIRFKNPGAMWGNKIAKKWGSTETVTLHDGLGQGNNIAVFPTYAQGIAAQLDLWRTSPNYKDKRFQDAIAIWSGHNNVESYIHYVLERVPSMTRTTIMNDQFWRSPMGLEFLKAQAGHEAGKVYPATPQEWLEGQAMVFKSLPHATAAKTIAGSVVGSASAGSLAWSTFEPWVIGVAVVAIVIATAYAVYRIYKR